MSTMWRGLTMTCWSAAVCVAVACGPAPLEDADGDADGGDGGERDGGPDRPMGPFDDFPSGPIVDTGAPDDAPDLFGDPSGGDGSGGPCLVEPELGALIPIDWLRLRFRWLPDDGQNLFEIRVSADNQVNDLVVYTTEPQWTMPEDMWAGLVVHSYDVPLTITVRGAEWNGSGIDGAPALGSSGQVTIVPAAAGGTIVYWTSSGGSALKGFRLGDESVQEVLRPAAASTSCIGCHTSTPDGEFAGFTAAGADPDDNTMYVGLRSVDGTASEPGYLSAAGKTMLSRVFQEAPAFSPAHFVTGDRVALSMYNFSDIAWTDLEASSTTQGVGWGTIARTGDINYPASPTFSHDGTLIAYCSSPYAAISGVETNHCDLYTVPYNDRMGGMASPVAGANDPEWSEYYPAFSPDDRFLAFSRGPAADNTYNNPNAEAYVIPVTGGPAVRLQANDPPACTGVTSPGLTNSWPKWAPTATFTNGKTYYWLTFSSTRASGIPQLYVTAVVVDEVSVQTFPALYLWNQPDNEGNHTPAWDAFQIPIP